MTVPTKWVKFIIAAFLLPNWYTATAKLLPPQQTQSSAFAILGHHVVEAEKNVELYYRLATDGRSQKEDRPQPDGQTQSSYRADCSTIEIIICGKIAYCQSSSIAVPPTSTLNGACQNG